MEKRNSRQSVQIMAEILNLCNKPQTKTHVMYRTNLSWEMARRYLSLLESKGLLEVHHSQTKYMTTKRGLEFVQKWTELMKLLSSGK